MKIKLLKRDVLYLSKFGDLNKDLDYLDVNINPDVIMSRDNCNKELTAKTAKILLDIKRTNDTITENAKKTADNKNIAAIFKSATEKLKVINAFLEKLAKPLYVNDILNLQVNEKENVIKKENVAYELYNTLSIYRNLLMNTSLKDLYNTVSGFINKDLEELLKLATQTSNEKNQKLITDYKLKIAGNKIPDIPDIPDINVINDYKNSIISIVTDYYKFKDGLYPVRIVINFGKILPSNSPIELGSDIPINNYNDSVFEENNILFKNIISDPQKTEGPYYLVTNTSSEPTDPRTYNVEEDMGVMFSNTEPTLPHIVYSAYGFSGSGKSYTLLQSTNKNSILSRIMRVLQTKNEITLQYSMYDYYGEADDGLCKVRSDCGKDKVNCQLTAKEKPVKINYNGDIDSFSETVPYNTEPFKISNITDQGKDIEDKVTLFEIQRKQPGYVDGIETGRTKYRIRFTPNNDQSSRSHLFIDIDIYKGDVLKGRVTIIDMAGSEDVNTIQNSYFESFPTEYNSDAFIKSLNIMSIQINELVKGKQGDTGNFIGGISGVSSQLKSTTLSNTATDFINNLNVKIAPFTVNNETGSYIKKDAWRNLLTNLNGDKTLSNDKTAFIDKYNFYNYILLIEPIITFKNVLNDLFNKYFVKTKNPTFTVNGPKNSRSPPIVDVTVDLTMVNKFFEHVGLSPLKNNFLSIKEKLIIAALYPNPSSDIYTSILKLLVLDVFSKRLAEKIQDLLDGIPDVIKSSGGGKFGKLIELNKLNEVQQKYLNDSINNETNLTIIKTNLTIIKTAINNWNTEYLYKIHCPIRYQGVFINYKLGQMKEYIKNLQNNTPDTTNFPGDILNIHLPTNIKFKTKFVLFTNIRLDFQPTGTVGIKPGSETQNENIKQAYTNSIEFANMINPLSKGSAFGKKRNKIQKVKRIMKDIKYLTK